MRSLAALFVFLVAFAAHAADEVMIVTAEAHDPGRVVDFLPDAPLKDKKVTVVQIGGTYLRTVAADLLEADDEQYRAALPAYPKAASRGYDDVAVIAPARPAARIVKLGRRDRSALSALRHEEAFAEVTHVFDRAVSFGGGKPDIAFIEVCVEYPTGDRMCAATTVYAARKEKSGWKLVACGQEGTCAIGDAAFVPPAADLVH